MLSRLRIRLSRLLQQRNRGFSAQVLDRQALDALQRWEVEAAEKFHAVKVRLLHLDHDAFHNDDHTSRAVLLLGAHHDSQAAADEISKAIDELRPSAVGLELCNTRFKRLLPLGLSSFAGMPVESQRAIQSRLNYGKEQLAAALAAHRLGISAVPCDQDVRVTEGRFLAQLPTDVLCAGACAAFGIPSVSMFIAWLHLSRQLHRISQGYDHSAVSLSGLLPSELVMDLQSKARALAADGSLSSRERWVCLRADIEEAAKEAGHKHTSGIVEATLEKAVKSVIIHERNIVLSCNMARLPGPLVVGIVGVDHLEGLAKQFTSVESPLRPDLSCDGIFPSPRLPAWKRVIGHPLLLRLRGSL